MHASAGCTKDALRSGNEVGGLLVAELHRVAQHVDVQQLPDILLLVILCAGSAARGCQSCRCETPKRDGVGGRDDGI